MKKSNRHQTIRTICAGITGICMIAIPVIVSAQSNAACIREAFLKDSLMDYSNEILVLNKAIHNSPKEAVAWWMRGKAKYHSQDYEGALADGQQAIRLQLKTEEVYLLSAHAREALKDYTDAVADYTAALHVSPENSNTWFSRGFAKLYLHQQKQARRDFNKATALGVYEPGDLLTEFEPG